MKQEITVEELDSLISQLVSKRKEIEAATAITVGLSKEKASLEAKIAGSLKELGRDNYQSPHGTFYMIEKWSVTLPKTDEDKQALFAWLRERGIVDRYATVNSASINALYMEEWEAAKKEGRFDFSIPGIGAPKLHEMIGLRKK